MNREETFFIALKIAAALIGGMEPVEAQIYAEACERAWAGQEQLRQVRK